MSCPHTCEWPLLLLLGQECSSHQDLARQKQKKHTATGYVQLMPVLALTGSGC